VLLHFLLRICVVSSVRDILLLWRYVAYLCWKCR